MTQKEKIERLWKGVLQIEKKIITHDKAIESMNHKFRSLEIEWGVYENEYRKYLAKRRRIKKFLWWLFCKITFRSTKLTKKELTKNVAKQMAHIFRKGDR